jgi:hypothetical protein
MEAVWSSETLASYHVITGVTTPKTTTGRVLFGQRDDAVTNAETEGNLRFES